MGRLQYGNEGLQIPMDVSEHVFFCVLFSMVFVDFLDQRILPSFLRQHLAARQGPNSNPDNGPDQRKMHANPLMLPGVPQKKTHDQILVGGIPTPSDKYESQVG